MSVVYSTASHGLIGLTSFFYIPPSLYLFIVLVLVQTISCIIGLLRMPILAYVSFPYTPGHTSFADVYDCPLSLFYVNKSWSSELSMTISYQAFM
jgi:hypothetical protein